MSFLNANRRFGAVTELRAYLSALPRPRWGVVGSTYHNTYIPNERQWRGYSSMTSMQQTYVEKGWPTGPHFFLAVGTVADGIFMMCPQHRKPFTVLSATRTILALRLWRISNRAQCRRVR